MSLQEFKFICLLQFLGAGRLLCSSASSNQATATNLHIHL